MSLWNAAKMTIGCAACTWGWTAIVVYLATR